jgi:hypothetical protein
MDIKRILDSLIIIVEKIKSGEGTIGRFLTDESIYDNLEAFTEDVKNNPWKLMNKPKD